MGTVSDVVEARAGDIASRAAELALASGVELPDDLRLWRLAGGRPSARPVGGRPEDLGLLLEASFERGHRQAHGAHFTPEDLAAGLVARALSGHREPTICDPACGGGALLLAAARHQAALGVDPREVVKRLWGIDVDPLSLATTEAALTLWSGVRPPSDHLLVADALLRPPPLPLFDVVVGNPPFLSQLDAATARGRRDAELLRGRFGAAVRAYTDTAWLFLLLGCALTRTGGTVAMVQPQSVMGARDATGVRDAVTERALLREVWVPDGRPFRAAVDVCVPVLEVGARSTGQSAWSSHLARSHGVPEVHLDSGVTVGDSATTNAGFRAEYYGMAPHVHEELARPSGRPLLTAGLVDIGGSAWGQRPARVAGRRWQRPVVDVAALEGRAAAWARRTAVPKVVVATQTRVIEAVVDPDGRYLPGVPLIVVLAPRERLWSLAAAICSPPVTAWAAQLAAGTALTAGALKLSAALVRTTPLPHDPVAWEEGTDAFESGDVRRFAVRMTAAYGCAPSLADWWLDRVGSAWSRDGSTQ